MVLHQMLAITFPKMLAISISQSGRNFNCPKLLQVTFSKTPTVTVSQNAYIYNIFKCQQLCFSKMLAIIFFQTANTCNTILTKLAFRNDRTWNLVKCQQIVTSSMLAIIIFQTAHNNIFQTCINTKNVMCSIFRYIINSFGYRKSLKTLHDVVAVASFFS